MCQLFNLFMFFLGMTIAYKLFIHVMVLKFLLLNSEFWILKLNLVFLIIKLKLKLFLKLSLVSSF